MEDALCLRLDFLLFTGFYISETTPDESTICRFRNALSKRGLDKVIFEEINRQLESAGVKVKENKGAIIDATIVSSSARPRRVISIAEYRKESGAEASSPLECSDVDVVDIQESVDRNARWLKNGKKSYYGIQGICRC